MNTQINISDLTVGYDKNPLLKGINLASNSGKMIGLFGRNGQGKSTLLKTISGLLPPISGGFTFEGIDILTLSEKEQRC